MKGNRKLILTAAAVIIVGVMLGIIFSPKNNTNRRAGSNQANNLGNNNNTPGNINNPQQQRPGQNSTTSNKGINVKLTANPTTIKAAGAGVDIKKDVAKVEKSSLKVSYDNNTSGNLSGLQLWIGASGIKGWGTSGTEDAKINKSLTTANKRPVFDIPDVKAGGKNSVGIKLYSKNPGTMLVTVQIKTKEGVTVKSDAVKITVQ